MVDPKHASAPVQKTLLSFFKPKSNLSPREQDAAPASPPSSSNRAKRSISADHDTLQLESASRKRRTLQSNPTHTAHHHVPSKHFAPSGSTPPSSSSFSFSSASSSSLFPEGFTSEMQHHQHALLSSPAGPSTGPDLTDSTIDTETPSIQVKPAKNPLVNSLSRFGYQPDSMEIDQDSIGSLEAGNEQARDTRRKKFLQKLGNMDQKASHVTEETSSRQSTRSRRRLIVSESEDEGEHTSKLVDDNEYIQDAATTRPTSRSSVKGAQPSPGTAASTTAAVNRSSSSKKSLKSPYTPLEKQFVEIKAQYPDAILCIEVGYKFRFFGEDAEHTPLYLSLIPQHVYISLEPVRLVHAGYKVGVVRQMETAALKSAGDNKSAPFTRKLTNLYTKATFLESLDQDEEQFQGSFVGKGPASQYLMCICEQPQGGSGADEKVKIAMLAVQPATGDIIYDDFTDGHFRNELETRLLHIQPAELIVPFEPMSKATEKLLGYLTASSQRRAGSVNRGQDDVRIERTEGFVKYDKAFKLVSDFYSTNLKEEQEKLGTQGSTVGSSKKSQMEALLKTVLGLSHNLIIALAAMITHLTDFGLAPVFRLSKYFECFTSRSHMLLNGNTISNLEIYRNQTDWTTRGSLFSILDHTYTGFGRRLLKKWVGKPLVNRQALQERVDAVEEILASVDKNSYLEDTKSMLKGLMDLEKGVCRIHYGKSAPKEFLTILKTFMKVAEVIPSTHPSKARPDFGLQCPMLINLMGSLANAAEDTRYFLDSLNEQAASKDDKLLMFQDDTIAEKWPEIHQHKKNIIKTEEELTTHLDAIRKLLREPKLEFSTVSGIDYLVEVKNKDVAKVPKSWVKISGTKQVSRFHTPEALQLIQARAQHQERLVLACDRAFVAFQQEFSERYEVFRDLVQNLAVLDCLFSLAVVACLPGYVKPQYMDDMDANLDKTDAVLSSRTSSSRATIDIKNGRHPMVEQMLPSGNFVSNDVQFGRHASSGAEEKAIILTGPNMGGKSCYIRQVALLCIMAQIGSYLPADYARVSLLDAVFTRMGASDNIFGHESTFMVELQETSDILKMATRRSLVILDELGRGTSTLDGVAIAYAVLRHVVDHIGAVTLFVTHYPSLAEVAQEFPEGTVRNYHMGFMASGTNTVSALSSESGTSKDTEAITDATLEDMDIVFLYKLAPGVSLKSYGLNVARMAKLPLSLITKAKVKSKELETALERRVAIRRQQQTLTQTHKQHQEQERLLSTLKSLTACHTEEGAAEWLARLPHHDRLS
ncbi:Mismatch repair protein msh3 [Mortierella claussenii]|nr:Mismatch repair protein msh3 [Mortierella claussenii]